jgi:hypothetical protein
LPNLQVLHHVLRSSRTKVPSLHRHYPGFISTMNLSASPGHPACPSRASGWSSLTTPWGLPVLRTLSLCTCCRQYPGAAAWAYCFAHSPQPYQPSPKGDSGWPAHHPFRGLLGVHSRYGLHTRAVTVYRDTLTRGFSHFVTSMTAPVASGWSGCRVRLTPTGKRRLFTAHPQSRFSTLMRRISTRSSVSICGRPPRVRDFQRQ